MKEPNFYRKISHKNYTDKFNNNQKYSSKMRFLNNRVLISKLTSLDNDTSDCNSLNRINYSECHDYIPKKIKNNRQNMSNIIPNPKYTYVLTSNENGDVKNYISHKNSKKINFIKNLINDAKEHLKTEPGKIEDYEKKYLESFQLYERDNEKRAFSNKLKKHRENLNNIVKSLNEANNRNKLKQNGFFNEEIKKYQTKEHFNSNDKLNYTNKRLNTVNYVQNDIRESQKCLTGAENKNIINKIKGKFDTYTYNYNRNQKNNKMRSFKEMLDLKDLNLEHINYIDKKTNNRLLTDDNINHRNFTNDIINIEKNNVLKTENLYNIPTESIRSSNNTNINNENNFNINNDLNKEEENKKIDLLRNEYKKISDKYLQISQQIDSLKNGDISYEDIIKNNSKTKDILNYNYKNNNDIENEKIFILMKLKMKNSEIIINKLEDENKIYKKKYKKMNNLVKNNNILTEENNALKEELNDMNINYQKLNEELQDYENKISNINNFNKKIQEINRGLMNENCDLKRNYEITKKEYKEFKINYDKIIPQQTELIKKLEEEKNDMIQKLEEKNNYINDENNNFKILLDNSQSKYKILEQNYNELKNKYNKLEENFNNINNKKEELQILNLNLTEENKIIIEKSNYLEKDKNEMENKIKEYDSKYNNLLNEYNNILNKNQINNKEKENNYNNLLTKYNNLSKKYDSINIENQGLKNELIKQKEIFNIIENKFNKLKNKEEEKIIEKKIDYENENYKLKDIIKQKDEIINKLNQKLQNYEQKILELQKADKKINEIKNNYNKLNEDKNKILNSYNEIKAENNKLKAGYNNLQNDFKNKNKYLSDIQEKKNKYENNNKDLIKLNEDLKHNILLKEKEILNLNETIEKLKNQISNNNKNNIINKGRNRYNENDLVIENGNNKAVIFNNLLNKCILKDLKKNKIRMIIGMFLLRQKIEYDKKIQICNEKNDKLTKANKKLNDKIIEFKLNNIHNNDSADKVNSKSITDNSNDRSIFEEYYNRKENNYRNNNINKIEKRK